ncbi:MAG: YbaN family protein [Lentimicrobiaceae bacterium]|jgi:hypothetical protein|nr:YbaN family protein [Lentimicrobiaceae bacterium]MDD4598877.1 YbaN family protein [Lentimicrobiaceae bacterium]MDY0027007.1 YbaN family protein [Lentimicrobium sp.]
MNKTARPLQKKREPQHMPGQPVLNLVGKSGKPKANKSGFRMKRWLLIIAGSISLIIGAIGVVVPLLPTTPFLLITSWCFVRSSPRLNARLNKNKIFGRYLRNYREKKGIDPHHRLVALFVLWITLGSSAWFAPHKWYIWLILLSVGIGVTIHLMKLKTIKEKI